MAGDQMASRHRRRAGYSARDSPVTGASKQCHRAPFVLDAPWGSQGAATLATVGRRGGPDGRGTSPPGGQGIVGIVRP